MDTGVASPYLAMLTDIPKALNPSQKLPALLILTVHSAAALLGRGFLATNQAIDRLVKGNILASIRAGRRNRAFEAPELISAFWKTLENHTDISCPTLTFPSSFVR